MQAAFGEHKSAKLFHELFAFDESLTSTNFVSNRYFYPVWRTDRSPIIPNPDYKIQVRGPGLSPTRSSASTLLLGLSRRMDHQHYD
jgi:hypothetical protein